MKLNDLQNFANLTLGYPFETSAGFTFICTHGMYFCVFGLSQELLLAVPVNYCSYRAALQWLHSPKTRLLAVWMSPEKQLPFLPPLLPFMALP